MRARRRVAAPGLLSLVVVAAACGTVSVEVTSETDIDKIGVQTTLAAADPPVTQAAPPTTSSSATSADDLSLAGGPDSDPSTTTSSPIPSTTSPDSTTSTSTTSTTTTSPTTASPTTTVPPTVPLEYHQADYAVFAVAGDLDIHLPVARYETVGFHESGHDGAFQLEAIALADWSTLASRGRGTGSRTAADIVAAPGESVRAPIDGTVIRAGTYTLYCDHTDNFVVIEPTGRPGWELKIFHFEERAVNVGDQVVAGSTLIGSSARILPFESQVDEFTAEPSNPHVHLEVIDTSIPDRPSSGGGC